MKIIYPEKLIFSEIIFVTFNIYCRNTRTNYSNEYDPYLNRGRSSAFREDPDPYSTSRPSDPYLNRRQRRQSGYDEDLDRGGYGGRSHHQTSNDQLYGGRNQDEDRYGGRRQQHQPQRQRSPPGKKDSLLTYL